MNAYADGKGKKFDLIAVKFYRTVQKPYSQTINVTWTEEYKDQKGKITTKRHTFTLQDRAKNDRLIVFFSKIRN